jgi:hypothetical protein
MTNISQTVEKVLSDSVLEGLVWPSPGAKARHTMSLFCNTSVEPKIKKKEVNTVVTCKNYSAVLFLLIRCLTIPLVPHLNFVR